jgi:hypothetical protein
MRRRTVLAASMALLGVLSFGAGIGGQDVTTPSYEVTEVKRKLFREQPEPEIQLEVGARPAAGELLRTGSRSSAEIVSPESAATFLLRSKTRVRLAGDRPGVLLEIERGGLRALFDALSADDPPERLVATPSAVLAVRGTEYGVEVDSSGRTEVAVFEGVVEIFDLNRTGPPVRVGAGQYSTIRRGQRPAEPMPHTMSPTDWDRGLRPGSTTMRGPGEPMQGAGAGGSGPGAGSSGSTGAQGAGSRARRVSGG